MTRLPEEPITGDVLVKRGRDGLERTRRVIRVVEHPRWTRLRRVVYRDHRGERTVLLGTWVNWVRGREEGRCNDPNPAVFAPKEAP